MFFAYIICPCLISLGATEIIDNLFSLNRADFTETLNMFNRKKIPLFRALRVIKPPKSTYGVATGVGLSLFGLARYRT